MLDGDPAPHPKKGAEPPNFRPMFFGQMTEWLKTVLGMEIGLSPGDIVLDLPNTSPLPNFRPISIVAKRLDASRCHLVWR